MNANQVVFIVLAAIAALGAMGVVFSEKPVRAAMSLVLNFFVLALLYFMLGAQLLGITQIMVYAGAIMVLFLFVIMMLQLQSANKAKEGPRDWKPTVSVLLGGSLGLMVLMAVILPLGASVSEADSPGRGEPVVAAGSALRLPPTAIDPNWGAPEMLGSRLPTMYAWPFLVASVLLTVGIVGSILLAKRRL